MGFSGIGPASLKPVTGLKADLSKEESTVQSPLSTVVGLNWSTTHVCFASRSKVIYRRFCFRDVNLGQAALCRCESPVQSPLSAVGFGKLGRLFIDKQTPCGSIKISPESTVWKGWTGRSNGILDARWVIRDKKCAIRRRKGCAQRKFRRPNAEIRMRRNGKSTVHGPQSKVQSPQSTVYSPNLDRKIGPRPTASDRVRLKNRRGGGAGGQSKVYGSQWAAR